MWSAWKKSEQILIVVFQHKTWTRCVQPCRVERQKPGWQLCRKTTLRKKPQSFGWFFGLETDFVFCFLWRFWFFKTRVCFLGPTWNVEKQTKNEAILTFWHTDLWLDLLSTALRKTLWTMQKGASSYSSCLGYLLGMKNYTVKWGLFHEPF